MKDDSYGSTIRTLMKKSMGEPAQKDIFRPLNRRLSDQWANLGLYLLMVAGLLAGGILIMGLDRVLGVFR